MSEMQSFTYSAKNLRIIAANECWPAYGTPDILFVCITLDNGNQLQRPLNKVQATSDVCKDTYWAKSPSSKRDLLHPHGVDPWTIWKRASYDALRLRVRAQPNGKGPWQLAFLPEDELKIVLQKRKDQRRIDGASYHDNPDRFMVCLAQELRHRKKDNRAAQQSQPRSVVAGSSGRTSLSSKRS